MSDFDDINIGDVEDDTVVPQSPELPQGDDFEGFSLDEISAADDIRSHSPATIIMALYYKLTKVDYASIQRPMKEWSTRDVVRFGAVISTLGSNATVSEVYGVVDWSNVKSLESVPMRVLKARLLVPRTSITSHLTDGSLALKMAEIRGATIVPGDGCAFIEVPNCPVRVKVGTGGGASMGRVLEGGPEFVQWHNEAHGTCYSFVEISSAAVAFTFLLLSEFAFEVTKDTIKFVEIDAGVGKKRTNNGVRSLVPPRSPRIMSYLLPLRRMVVRAYSDVGSRPAIGHKSDPRAYIEFLVERGLQTATDANRVKFAELVPALAKEFSHHVSNMALVYPLFFKEFGDVKHLDVAEFGKKPQSVCGTVIDSYAAVLSFVQNSRAFIRDGHDLARKSDTPYWGGAAASASSVPQKIRMARIAHSDLLGEHYSRPVDAFGTGSKNWWHQEVMRGNVDVTFYDINNTYVPPLGGKFSERDVEHLEPGSGERRVIYDDTFNGPDNKMEKADFVAKATSVVRAGYESGFLKMYLGAGNDGSTRLGGVPPALRIIMDHYKYVVLTPGGSPHSPEYFVSFSNRCRAGWYWPKRTPHGYGTSSPIPSDERSRMSYIQGWLMTRAFEIVKANLAINAQVLLSSWFEKDKFSWPSYALFGPPLSAQEVKMGGAFIPSSRPRAVGRPPGVGESDFDIGDVEDSGDRIPTTGNSVAGRKEGTSAPAAVVIATGAPVLPASVTAAPVTK